MEGTEAQPRESLVEHDPPIEQN